MVKIKLKLITDPVAIPKKGEAVLEDVIDGDTINVVVNADIQGTDTIIDNNYLITDDKLWIYSRKFGYSISVRFIGVSSYDINSNLASKRKLAKEARERIERYLNNATGLTLVLYGLEIPDWDDRRLIGDVYNGRLALSEQMRKCPELWRETLVGKHKYVHGSIKKLP